MTKTEKHNNWQQPMNYSMNQGIQKNMCKINNIILGIVITVFISGCAVTSDQKLNTKKSFLQRVNNQKVESDTLSELNKPSISATDLTGMRYISSITKNKNNKVTLTDLTERFSDKKLVQLTADNLPLKDYLHHVLGDLLSVSYILGDKLETDNKDVTLNLQNKVSQRKLFNISEKLLTERGYIIRLEDDVYYIHSAESSIKGGLVYGYGNKVSDVPNTSADIMQMVPFDYGMQSQLSLVLQKISQVNITPAKVKNALLVKGKRREVLKVLEFIQLMDQPSYRNREIGLFKTTFVSTDEVIKKLPELLIQEGLTVGAGSQTDKAISMITLERTSTLVFFAPNLEVLQRVNFWLQQIDQPLSGDILQYFLYSPQFSRATDLGESLHALIGGSSIGGNVSNNTSAENQNNTKKSKANRSNTQSRVVRASNDKVKMVVDERANSLIFHTTGEEYRQLIPLIKQLDVMPKQVVLEVMIAEVTLTDEFKQGVEFALTKGNYGLSTTGAFMGDGFGGLSYLLQGTDGRVAINLLQTNSLVNIVSRPSLVVRDGVNANITVGTDIPIVGETASDPLDVNGSKQTTKIEYRKTGVQLDVLPTINAQGIILMEIKQKISNQVDAGGTAVISPSIFERSITTEVVAESGQTVILGGLISENSSKKDSKVPFFGDLPLIGRLFRAETESGDKTELVVLVTPRIIESSDEWQDVVNKFSSGLTELIIE